MFSSNTKIDCTGRVDIHPTAEIAEDVIIRCHDFILGENSYIGKGCIITCHSFRAGKRLYMPGRVEIGRGGCYGPNSNVNIGDNVGIFESTIINPSEEVFIGDNVGIGAEVMIWTHGSWLDVLEGFPADFGPVTIEKNVWLPARCIVLPNVTIGENTVIGIGSIVNRNIPSGSLAAGSPCKVIKENFYPKVLSEDQKTSIILDIIEDWKKLCIFKGINFSSISYNRNILTLDTDQGSTLFNLETRRIEGTINQISEDLRDYLRRRGIKIFTDRKFRSI